MTPYDEIPDDELRGCLVTMALLVLVGVLCVLIMEALWS